MPEKNLSKVVKSQNLVENAICNVSIFVRIDFWCFRSRRMKASCRRTLANSLVPVSLPVGCNATITHFQINAVFACIFMLWLCKLVFLHNSRYQWYNRYEATMEGCEIMIDKSSEVLNYSTGFAIFLQ